MTSFNFHLGSYFHPNIVFDLKQALYTVLDYLVRIFLLQTRVKKVENLLVMYIQENRSNISALMYYTATFPLPPPLCLPVDKHT